MDFQEPGEIVREYINPEQVAGQLVIVFPIQHVKPAPPTKFSRADKVDDAIAVDVVTLDQVDETGKPKVFRSQLWRQSRLIQSFRQRLGGTLLGTIGKGTATMGQAPWVFISLTHEPQAVARAQAWAEANSDFKPSEPREYNVQPQNQQQGNQPRGQQPYGQQQYGDQQGGWGQSTLHHGSQETMPDWARPQQQQTPPLPPEQRRDAQQSILERLARQHGNQGYDQGLTEEQARQQYGY